MRSLPSPATSTQPSPDGASRLMSAHMSCAARSAASSLSCHSRPNSAERYVPFGFPSSAAAFSEIFSSVTSNPQTFEKFFVTPSQSASPYLASCASTARSVLILRIKTPFFPLILRRKKKIMRKEQLFFENPLQNRNKCGIITKCLKT